MRPAGYGVAPPSPGRAVARLTCAVRGCRAPAAWLRCRGHGRAAPPGCSRAGAGEPHGPGPGRAEAGHRPPGPQGGRCGRASGTATATAAGLRRCSARRISREGGDCELEGVAYHRAASEAMNQSTAQWPGEIGRHSWRPGGRSGRSRRKAGGRRRSTRRTGNLMRQCIGCRRLTANGARTAWVCGTTARDNP
jgi:hypothetical protein